MDRQQPHPPYPPVFIVGCGRSGTTLLRLMLDAHPDLAIPGESHFIPALWRARRQYRSHGALQVERLAEAIMRSREFRQWGVPEHRVWTRVRQLAAPDLGDVIESVYLAYADERGKVRWGDKTPRYVRSLPLLADLFPTARFVHIVRDGRDVWMSYRSVPWGPRDVWTASRKWLRDVGAGRAAASELGRERYIEISYERLVEDPRGTLTELCAFATLPFDERMLDFHRDAGRRLEAPPGETSFHASVTKALTPGLRDWRTEMPPDEILNFEAVAGPLLAELGYELRYPLVPRRLRIRAAARTKMIDVSAAARHATWSSKSAVRTFVLRQPAGVDVDG
jgi:Sulfotransferase family